MITTRSKTKLKLWTLLLLNQSNLWPSETKQWFHHYWCWTKLSITDMHCTVRVRTQFWKFEVGSLLISSRDEGYRQFYWTRFFYSPPSTEVVESERGNCVTQLKLDTVEKLSSSIFCCLCVCEASVTPDQISTFSNIYRHTSPLLTQYNI